jgi:hypothetical protein
VDESKTRNAKQFITAETRSRRENKRKAFYGFRQDVLKYDLLFDSTKPDFKSRRFRVWSGWLAFSKETQAKAPHPETGS